MKLVLILIGFAFLLYAPTLRYPFFFDDSHYIVNNSAIHFSGNLLKLWTSASYYSVTPENWGYRPFTTFLQSIAWLMGGGATWPFHFAKILLHGTLCFFLMLIWKRLWETPGFYPNPAPQLRFKLGARDLSWTITPTKAAVLLAFAFAAHPANTEMVNYISATSTLLCAACYLVAYYFYLRYRETPSTRILLASFLFYALAVLAKEEGITLVGVIVLTEIFVFRRPRPKFALIGYFVLAGLLALLLRLMFAETSNIARGDIKRWAYFMTQWRAYLHYMQLLVWPIGLNADNLQFGFAQSFWESRVLSALAANLVLLGLAWRWRRTHPIFIFSLLWFYIAISPASSIVPLAEPVNDHRMNIAYFGLVGACLPWLLKGVDRISRGDQSAAPSPYSGPVVALIFLALIVGTEVRNQAWASSESLWLDTVEKNPESPRAANNLAIVYLGQANWKRAGELFDRCLRVAPFYSTCAVNKAVLLAAIGKDEEAEQRYREVIAADHQRPELRAFFALFLMNRGRLSEAMGYFREVDQISGGADLAAKIGWANAARGLGRVPEAITVMRQARDRFGDQPQIHAALSELEKP